MILTLAPGLEHRQQQALSPRLQHAVRLLQLSSLDFAQEVHDALGQNPFLIAEEADSENPDEHWVPDENAEPCFASERPAELHSLDTTEQVSEAGASLDSDHESWLADGVSGRLPEASANINFIDLRADTHTLGDFLLGQLRVLPLSERDQALAETIVGSLDEDGYLRCDLSELTGLAKLTPQEDEDELRTALLRVQSLEPAGVGARSAQECLLLQLPAPVRDRPADLARIIIAEHLDALAAGDISGLARALRRAPLEIESALKSIRRLDPRPGLRFGSAHVNYVTPDVIVKKLHGQWTAVLNPAVVPKVHLHHLYADLFQRNRCAQHSELAAHLHEARWTLSNVEQRFATILGVSQAIIRRQQHFLDYGPLAMKPLVLREIADEVGIHESTVSRVTNNKFMATPLGVFELKYFFSRALTTVSGGECSATAIRSLIKEMIAVEPPMQPLSDAQIARQLATQGLVVARRTVTKYRQSMHIEAVERRRRHA